MDNQARRTPTPPMVAIGQRLSQAREKRSLTLDQVQKQTRMHVTVLHALEEGRCDEILTPTYVKSFLKKYAQFLGLDATELIKEYSILHPDRETPPAVPTTVAPTTSMTLDSFLKWIYIGSSIFLLVAFFFLAGSVVKKILPHRQPPHTGASVVRPAAVKPAAVTRTAKTAPRKASTTPPVAKAPVAVTAPRSFTLEMRVKQPTFVRIKKDGILLFERVMPKGSETFSVGDYIECSIAKGEAVEFIINGKSLGSPGKGVIKNVEITARGMKVR